MLAARPLEMPPRAPNDAERPPGPRLAKEGLPPRASPARDLQASLIDELEHGWRPASPRWPGALRLTVIVGGSAGLWALIAVAVKAML